MKLFEGKFNRNRQKKAQPECEAKRVCMIRAKRGQQARQAADLEIISKIAREIITAECHDDVLIQTAIAVGYANAMKMHGLITDTEAEDLVEWLGTVGSDALKRVDSVAHNIIMRHLRKVVAG